MAGGLEGYTTNKLIRDLKKLPNSPIIGISNMIDVRKDSYSDERIKARFWMVSVRWLEDQGIEVKVYVPTLEFEETPTQPIAQEDPRKEEEKLTSMEKMILEMAREPIDFDELTGEISRIFKVDEDKVRSVIVSLMSKELLKMEEGAKIRRALNE